MCAAEFSNSSIPCLVRQSSTAADYLVVHEQAPYLVRGDPVFFPKGFVNRIFHKNALVSMGSVGTRPPLFAAGGNGGETEHAGWIHVNGIRDPRIDQHTANFYQLGLQPCINQVYGTSYDLTAFINISRSERYFEIKVHPVSSAEFSAYVFVQIPSSGSNPYTVKYAKYDFFNHPDLSKPKPEICSGGSLTESFMVARTLRWTSLMESETAPDDVSVAAFLAEHYVRVQRGAIPKYELKAYKSVSRESGFARDFFLKVDIGAENCNSGCVFVKLAADHFGGADNVEIADYDLSQANQSSSTQPPCS